MAKLRKFVQSRDRRHAYIAKWGDFSRQPWISFTEEISIEEAKRRFGHVAPENAIACKIGYSVVPPLEVEVDPRRRNRG